MYTDLDRLHLVVDGTLHGRCCGKTFSKCHEVAGFVGLGFNDIFCRLSYHRDLEMTVAMLVGVLLDHGMVLKVATYTREYLVEGSRIRFIAENKWEEAVRSYSSSPEVKGAAIDMRRY